MSKHKEIFYICNSCERDFDRNKITTEEYFDDEDNWILPCPVCNKPLNWGTSKFGLKIRDVKREEIR